MSIVGTVVSEDIVVDLIRAGILKMLHHRGRRRARQEIQVNAAVDERRWLVGQLVRWRDHHPVRVQRQRFRRLQKFVFVEEIVEHEFRNLNLRKVQGTDC